jgi:transcription termination/antitermination protein NusA
MDLIGLSKGITLLANEKNLAPDKIQQSFSHALVSVARKRHGVGPEYEVHFEGDNIDVLVFKRIVETVKNPSMEVSLKDAQKHDENVNLGDEIGTAVDMSKLLRQEINTIKQIVFSDIKREEKKVLVAKFPYNEGEVVKGVVSRVVDQVVYVNVANMEGMLPPREQIKEEVINPGETVHCYIKGLEQSKSGLRIVLSRKDINMVSRLLHDTVYEIENGTVQITRMARVPGIKTVVALKSKDKTTDPISVCVGLGGDKINQVIYAIGGEQIRLIKDLSNEDVIHKLFEPAELSNVFDYHEELLIVVDEKDMGKALGKKMHNVRIAANLLNKPVSVVMTEKLKEVLEQAKNDLLQLDTVNPLVAESLVHHGVLSLSDLVYDEKLEKTLLDFKGNLREILEEYNSRKKDLKKTTPESFIEATAKPQKSMIKEFVQAKGSTSSREDIQDELKLFGL